MSKKLTFYMLSGSSSFTRKISVSKGTIFFLFLIVCATTSAAGWAGYDYYNLRLKWINAGLLRSEILSQKAEIGAQNKQIKLFASQMNGLKSKLNDLSNFEKKIRIIANIKNPSAQDGIFGVGGSMPEDIDPGIPVSERYNSVVREIHEQDTQLTAASVNLEKNFEFLLQGLESQKVLLASTPAIKPAKGWITSKFGYRESPFTGRKEFHKGVDIANKRGTPVSSTADGLVLYSNTKGLLGKVVIIDHGHGIVTRYAHLSKIIAKKGTRVKRGALIGKIGNTGRSTGPHVHYEVRLNGIPVNPTKYILN